MNNEDIAEYISAAIKQDLFEVHYQPQFCLVGGCFEVTGVEALLRPDINICHVEKLVAVAVETDQIIDLGYWVLRKAVEQTRQWMDDNLVTSTFTVSVNVDGAQLKDPSFCAHVHSILIDAEIRPEQLLLEMTEASMIDDDDVAKIFRMSTAGVQISIDDFGTGYSSLVRLKHLPVDEIKIDKTFVDDIVKTDQDLALITAIFQLTNALEKFTIVEGVESICQYDMLRKIGFTCFQGYFFCKPEPAKELANTISLINSLHFRPCLE